MTAPAAPTPAAFVSYSHDSDEHKEWVRRLAVLLRRNGVDARLDRWRVPAGADIAEFMESAKDADCVVAICTPKYKSVADEGKGGAGYEKRIITAAMWQKHSGHRVIPVLRAGDGDTAVPAFLAGCSFVDMRDDASFQTKLFELLRVIFCQSEEPPVGEPPDFSSGVASLKMDGDEVAESSTQAPEIGRSPFAVITPVGAGGRGLACLPESSVEYGNIVVGDVIDFSTKSGADQEAALNAVWSFLSGHEATGSGTDAVYSLTLDGAVVALPHAKPDAALRFAEAWVGHMASLNPVVGFRVGVDHGKFVRFRTTGGGVQVVGKAPSDCARIATIGAAGQIVVTEEFVRLWFRDGGLGIYSQLVPSDPNQPCEILLKRDAPQRVRVYCPVSGSESRLPGPLVRLHFVSQALHECLREVESLLVDLLSLEDTHLTPRRVRARVSVFAPRPTDALNLASTEFRFMRYRDRDDPDGYRVRIGRTVYSLKNTGAGPCGRAYKSNPACPFVVRGLPDYREDPDGYHRKLAKLDLTPEIVQSFGRKARAFIAFPFMLTPGASLEDRDGVICVDTADPLDSVGLAELRRIARLVMRVFCARLAALWRLRV